MKNKSVTCILICDKVNYYSTELSIDFFKKSYGDEGEIILINTQHEKKYIDISRRNRISIINPAIKLDYPIFKLNEFDKVWNYMNECIFKPVMMAQTDYITFSEPDCFFIKKTDFLKYEGYDCISAVVNPQWWFGGWGTTAGGFCHHFNDNILTQVINEIKQLCKQHNMDYDELFKKHFLLWFTVGCFIKTDSIQNLMMNKKKEIYNFSKKIISILNKNWQLHRPDINYYLFPDMLMSLIIHFFEFKTAKNLNTVDNVDCRYDVFNEEIFNFCDSNTEIVHPLKTYYADKSQIWSNIITNKSVLY